MVESFSDGKFKSMLAFDCSKVAYRVIYFLRSILLLTFLSEQTGYGIWYMLCFGVRLCVGRVGNFGAV